MDEQIEMPFRILSQLDLRNHILDGCPDPPMGRGNFEGKGHPGMPDNTATSCAKMAEATEMPFGLWTRMGHGGTLVQSGEYNQTVHVWQRCSLKSNYFNYLCNNL